MDRNIDAAYKALYRANERLNAFEYSRQLKRNKGRKLDHYTPHYQSQAIIDNQTDMLNGKITPDQAMAILHDATFRADLNEAIDAGF